MYIPKSFEFENLAEKIAFMKQYSFATIITSANEVPIATHLPFFVDGSTGKIILRSHFGKANPHARSLENNLSLVIFSEPHAYISPDHYDKHESVPTWDYISVHAYGKAKILDSEAEKARVLEEMITFYDKEYIAQWNSFTDKFKTNMMKGIIAFELEVTDLQGQKKLSQNKSVNERKSIVAQLEKSEDSVEQSLASYIRNTL